MSNRTENLLLDELEDCGYNGFKHDRTSGGYGSKVPGDVIVGKRHEVFDADSKQDVVYSDLYLIEEKYRSKTNSDTDYGYIYIESDKIDDLVELATAMGATPLLAVRWSTRGFPDMDATHYIKNISECSLTDSGNLNLKPSEARENFQTVGQYFAP